MKKHLLPINRVLETHIDNRHYRKVSKEAMINYKGNKYSVDPTYIGHKLEVRPIENELRLYYNAELIKLHQISNKPFNYHENAARKILASDLLANADENVIEQYIQDLKKFRKVSLLIIDEIGFMDIDGERSNLFFQIINERYETASTIVTTNLPLSQWSEKSSKVQAAAVLDCLVHHSVRILINGKSYRLNDFYRTRTREN